MSAQKNAIRQPIVAPYESSLNKAFDKLTSEIFIFLLAYTVLLYALAATGASIPDGVRKPLMLIPVLAIIGYGWTRKKTVVRNPAARGVRVRALFVKGSTVSGAEGPQGAVPPGGVDLGLGFAVGGSKVSGMGSAATQDERYLNTIFLSLNDTNRMALIESAHRLLREQGPKHGD